MWKNLIIGVLSVCSIFFFFYGLTQQIKAEQKTDLYLKSERLSIRQKEISDSIRLEAMKQAELCKRESERAHQALQEAERLLAASRKKRK